MGNQTFWIRYQISISTIYQAQILADFLVEYTILDEPTMPDEAEPSASTQGPTMELTNTWKVYVDGSSNSKGSGTGLVIVSLKRVVDKHVLCFEFPMKNNEVEYEALITRLQVAKELGMQDLKVYSDS